MATLRPFVLSLLPAPMCFQHTHISNAAETHVHRRAEMNKAFGILLMFSFRLSVGARRLQYTCAFVQPRHQGRVAGVAGPSRRFVATSEETDSGSAAQQNGDGDGSRYIPPWSMPTRDKATSSYARFRQHINPLSRRFQMPTDLPENWPHSDFQDVNLPLYLDIGCAKGGFLLELAGRRHGKQMDINDDTFMNATKSYDDTTSDWLPSQMNYLGLEIRPGVSQYAQARVEKRGLSGILSFVGCNANVDLGRLLTLYQGSSNSNDGNSNRPAFVSIQFPDPHFKKAHNKRRVVTPQLVTTLAQFMREGDVVFLQSDIKEALEAMRDRFVEDDGAHFFREQLVLNNEVEEHEYAMINPLGIPTERELSVINKGLPIYRTLFLRNDLPFPDSKP